MPGDKSLIPAAERLFIVFGCGSIGKRHLANLQRLGAKNIIAYDPVESRREEIRQRFGCLVYADPVEAISKRPDVALICTPTRYHTENALFAVRHGCDVFIEKPVADAPDEVSILSEEIDGRGLSSLVGCNFRFHPALQRVKSLIDQNSIGRIISIRAQFGQYLPDWHPWEDYRNGYSARKELGGGVILDRIHELDYVCWLLGDVHSVTALVGHISSLEINTEDTAEILLKFKSGAFGSIHLDYVRRTYDCSLEVVGEEGTVQWCYQSHEVRWYSAKNGQWQSCKWPNYEGNQMYLDEMDHFFSVIEGKSSSMQDILAGLRVLKIACAIRKAAATRTWIAL